jgi:hypothetical protein
LPRYKQPSDTDFLVRFSGGMAGMVASTALGGIAGAGT